MGETEQSPPALLARVQEEETGPELNSWVHLRFSRQEKQRLSQLAREAGLTLSQLVRRVLRGGRLRPRAERVEFNELRRLGGLLKKVHTESGGAYSVQTRQLLDRIEALLLELSR